MELFGGFQRVSTWNSLDNILADLDAQLGFD